MTLPTFRSMAARRQEKREQGGVVDGNHSDRTLTPTYTPGVDIKRATKTRKVWVLISIFCFSISVIFLILTIIGNINTNPVIRDTYFYELNLANIIPVSVGSSIQLVNSLARSLGLHDFYRVGLWNFCEGYNDEGVTFCSKPKTFFWFNPVEVLVNELLAGATIVLPAEVNNILNLIRLASNAMFGFFLTGICMNFLSIFIAPVTLYSRWWSLPFSIWTFLAALFTTAAAIIATVMAVIFRSTLTSQPGLNISASVGVNMLAFMWVGSGFCIFGFLIHMSLSCCCASRRDVRTGKKQGSKRGHSSGMEEKKSPAGAKRRWLPKFGRRKSEGQLA